MTLWRFYSQVRLEAKDRGWRIGQALFNVLMEVRPDLSARMRATSFDPFFADSPKDHRYEAAIKFIEAHWGDVHQDQRTGDEPV